jgi:hypothetical protein
VNVELSERDKDTVKQEKRERIKESRDNRQYERCMAEEIPEYLRRERVQNGEDGREMGWMKEIWKRKERIEKKRN